MIPRSSDNYNCGEALTESAARRGAEALLRCQGKDCSAEELAARTLALQATFEEQGLHAGDRVLLLLQDTPAFFAGFLAAMRGGFVPVPISTMLRSREVAFIARDAGVRCVLLDSALPAELESRDLFPPGARVLMVKGWDVEGVALQRGAAPSAAATRADDEAFWLYTSGTTGEPKGVVHRHLDIPATAELYAQELLEMSPADKVLSAAKLFFAYGLGNSLSFPLLTGAQAVLHPDRPTPEAMFELIEREQPTVFFGVPTLYAAMLDHPDLPQTLGRVRLCVSAGEALAAQLFERWRERFGIEILDGLGSTEMLHIFVSNRRGEVKPGSSGRPVPGYRVRLVDDDGRDVEQGELGTLLAHGPSAALRYHERPEITQETMFAPGWVRSGDSYRQDAFGYLTHEGRTDDLMKVSGQYVSPVEVEAALGAHPAVLEAAVVAQVDENRLLTPKAFVVPASGEEPSDELVARLQDFVKQRISPHKYPRAIEFVSELPKTATGKIRRFELRQPGLEPNSLENDGAHQGDTAHEEEGACEGSREGGAPIDFRTHPDRYLHWRLSIEPPLATLTLDVKEEGGLSGDYLLKQNSYDLGVDIELYDATQRLRFEHPEVHAVIVESGKDRVFCAGANIGMLGSSSHQLKVNFCKFTNETRFAIEDACTHSGQRYLCAVRGTAAGGGYEIAMSCDHIILADDGSSTVSLPEVPLLAVLPGTGGLTRLIDKRRVRRDRADIFCTLEEGIKGQRALDWKLVDELATRSQFDRVVAKRAHELAATSDRPKAAPGIEWSPVEREIQEDAIGYEYVRVEIDRGLGVAHLTIRAPHELAKDAASISVDELTRAGAAFWPLAVARQLDDAVLHLRVNEARIGHLVLRSLGGLDVVETYDAFLQEHRGHWLVREILLFWKRVLKRIDVSSRTLFALIEPGSCFGGLLLELVLAADRSYMFVGEREDDEREDAAPEIFLSELNFGALPMPNGLSRLETRFLGDDEAVAMLHAELLSRWSAEEAEARGLVTEIFDDIDWDDEIRIAIEERVSFSPDALTGMEANLRFPGPETLETKIFGRLSAWQNWIFGRPNAVGEGGALELYGTGRRPSFDRERV